MKQKTQRRNKKRTTTKTFKHHTKRNTKTMSKKLVFDQSFYNSGDGMLTKVWGPSLWHYLHTMSFNYPTKPTKCDKKYYKRFMHTLKYVLPCRYCRENYKKNLKALPLNQEVFKSRSSFSRYMYRLHEHVNKMLGKTSNLTYKKVRDRYEHFRARCNKTKKNKKTNRKGTQKSSGSKKGIGNKTRNKRENGCIDPLHGIKSRCVVHIVPQNKSCVGFKMDPDIKSKV